MVFIIFCENVFKYSSFSHSGAYVATIWPYRDNYAQSLYTGAIRMGNGLVEYIEKVQVQPWLYLTIIWPHYSCYHTLLYVVTFHRSETATSSMDELLESQNEPALYIMHICNVPGARVHLIGYARAVFSL